MSEPPAPAPEPTPADKAPPTTIVPPPGTPENPPGTGKTPTGGKAIGWNTEAMRPVGKLEPPPGLAEAVPAAGVKASDIRASARSPGEIAQALANEARARVKRAGKRVALERALDRVRDRTTKVSPTASPQATGVDIAPTGAHAAPAPAPAPTIPREIPKTVQRPASTESEKAEKRTPEKTTVDKKAIAEKVEPRSDMATPGPPSGSGSSRVQPPSSGPTPTIGSAPSSLGPTSGVGTTRKTQTQAARFGDVSAWLIFWALVVQVVALVVVANKVSKAVERVATTLTEPRPAAPVQAPVPSSVASHDAAAAPTVASLGEGRVVVARPDGKLVVLKRDPQSGELVLERVYALEEDETRGMGDDARRAYSGLYVTDVERSRRAAVEAEDRLYRESLARALERSDGLERAEEAARRLARVGGIDRLMRRLSAETENDFVARRTAALALGEEGYIAAVPVLIEVLERTERADLTKHIVQLLQELTSLAFDPTDPHGVVARRAREWYEKNQTEDKFARRPRIPR